MTAYLPSSFVLGSAADVQLPQAVLPDTSIGGYCDTEIAWNMQGKHKESEKNSYLREGL